MRLALLVADRHQQPLTAARRLETDPWSRRLRDPAVWSRRVEWENLVAEAPWDRLSPQLITFKEKRSE